MRAAAERHLDLAGSVEGPARGPARGQRSSRRAQMTPTKMKVISANLIFLRINHVLAGSPQPNDLPPSPSRPVKEEPSP